MTKFNKMFLITVAGAAIAISGCSKTANTDSKGTVNANSTPAAAISENKSTSAPAAATDAKPAASEKYESVYTDIKAEKCKTTSKSEEEGWIVQMCDGVGGYKLEVYEDDIRQGANVISPSGTKSELNFQANVSGAFSMLGEKVEWRVEKKDGKTVPVAMIVRFNANDKKDETKTTSYLVVTKVDGDKSCITDVVKPIENANEEARKLADAAAGKPCLSK